MAAKKPASTPRKHAPNGAGSVYWDKHRGRYVGTLSLGSRVDGSRIRPAVLGRTKAEAWAKLEVVKHEVASGIDTGNKYTVATPPAIISRTVPVISPSSPSTTFATMSKRGSSPGWAA